uniref:Uncharacterized protein n=1 Tax=Cucumis melo TaxID=3656 RepID=A0A9I9ECQ5_CUCME
MYHRLNNSTITFYGTGSKYLMSIEALLLHCPYELNLIRGFFHEKYGDNICFSSGIAGFMMLKYADNIVKVLQKSFGAMKSYLRQFIDVSTFL